MKPARSILIIKPGAIGDLLQLTPVLRALKALFPRSRVTLLVGSSATADLFRYNPHADGTIVYEKSGKHRSFRAFSRLWLQLRRAQYDLILNYQRSNLKAWALAAASFPCRVLVYHKSERNGLHAVENYLETIEPLGVSAASLQLEFFPGPEDRSFADMALASWKSDAKPIIALNPGASHPVNRWGVDQFIALANLLSEHLGAHLVLVGGSEDVALANQITRGMISKPLNITGKVSLLQLGALLEQCRLIVSGDTGPMHVAAAVGTRVVALFGAADPSRTGPIGRGHRIIQAPDVSCIPCRSRTCSSGVYRDCMNRITPEFVYGEIETMLKPGSPI